MHAPDDKIGYPSWVQMGWAILMWSLHLILVPLGVCNLKLVKSLNSRLFKVNEEVNVRVDIGRRASVPTNSDCMQRLFLKSTRRDLIG